MPKINFVNILTNDRTPIDISETEQNMSLKELANYHGVGPVDTPWHLENPTHESMDNTKVGDYLARGSNQPLYVSLGAKPIEGAMKF